MTVHRFAAFLAPISGNRQLALGRAWTMACDKYDMGGNPMADPKQFETDVFSTSEGDLAITFLGHGTLLMTFAGKHIHIDPFSPVADYDTLPKADIIVVTHEHQDHLDEKAIACVRTRETQVILTQVCAKQLSGGIVMRNGDVRVIDNITVEAVPAYNIVHKRPNGQPFHPKGIGNGYILAFGDMRVYVAGDTENIPEMKTLEKIDCAFLPMNLPYTMSPEMVADAAVAMKPRVLYPYHFGTTDTSQLVDLLSEHENIEVRLRDLA
jgi:L-ascorbate metabolism protein UlaG (beta-lactamase superfamily)